LAQAGKIEVVHVRVGQQNKIRRGQFRQRNGRIHQSLHAEDERPDPNSDPPAEHRVGENRKAVNTNQDGAVADPCRMQAFAGPHVDIGDLRRSLDRAFPVFRHSLPENRPGAKSEFGQ